MKQSPTSSTLLYFFVRIAVLILLSYGLFYHAYKTNTPDGGASDYAEYEKMHLSPLDMDAAKSPFVYRQLTTVITSLIYKTGIAYNTPAAIDNTSHNKRIFFCSILANYIGLLVAASFVMLIIDDAFGRKNLLLSLFGACLVLFSFNTLPHVLSGLTEGWSWALMAMFYWAYRRRLYTLPLILFAAAIFQREVLPLVWGAFAALDLLAHWLRNKSLSRYEIVILFAAIVSFASYLIVHIYIFPTAGHEGQLDSAVLKDKITSFLALDLPLSFIMQVFLTQNILWLYLLIAGIVFIVSKPAIPSVYQLLSAPGTKICAAYAVLFIIGVATGIGNNIGRITALLIPIIAVHLALNMRQLHDYFNNHAD